MRLRLIIDSEGDFYYDCEFDGDDFIRFNCIVYSNRRKCYIYDGGKFHKENRNRDLEELCIDLV